MSTDTRVLNFEQRLRLAELRLGPVRLHAAVLECQRLAELERPPHHFERAFVQNVNIARTAREHTMRNCAELFGANTEVWRATAFMARRQEDAELNKVLVRYNRFKDMANDVISN
jgi:hypothetical protein